MKKSAGAAALVLSLCGVGFAQKQGDACHVYVVDVEKARKAWEGLPAGASQQQVEKAAAGSQTVFPEFFTKIGEEEQTTKTYAFPGVGALVINASVFYTDETMASESTSGSMLVSIAVARKGQDVNEADDNAQAEVTYDDHTDTVRVKKYVKARGRQYLVGLECHVKPRKK